MRFIALDLDKKTAFVGIFDTNTQTQSENRIGLDLMSLVQFRSTLKPDDILCMEACPGSSFLYDQLSPVCKVKLADPVWFGAILKVFKHKMDRNDTGLLLQFLRANTIRTVWVPNAETRDERAFAEHYKDLDKQRTRLRNQIHALLVESGLGYEAEKLLKLDAHQLLVRLKGSLPELAVLALASKLRLMAAVEEEMAQARARITVRTEQKPQTKIVTTLPGVDNTLTFVLLAVIDDVRRFKSDRSLGNYSGLIPSSFSSGAGKKPKHGRITKRGSALLRWAAVEAAKNAVRTPGRLQNLKDKLLRRGRSYQQALVAVAHKMLEILWQMLTKNEPYRDVQPKSQATKTVRRQKQLEAATATLSKPTDPGRDILMNISTVAEALKMAS